MLFRSKFKNVSDDNWSPSSDQDFHILPKNYCFSLIGGVDAFSCSNCHKQTQISVRNLVPKDPSVINDPDGTGNIRGCDGIFTWHPFSAKCIKSSASESVDKTCSRVYDEDHKIIVFSKEAPVESKYKFTLFVQQALKEYELPKRQGVLHTNVSTNNSIGTTANK